MSSRRDANASRAELKRNLMSIIGQEVPEPTEEEYIEYVALFQQLDADHSGNIDASELYECFRMLEIDASKVYGCFVPNTSV